MPAKPQVLHVIPSISHLHGGPSRAIRLMELALLGSTWQSVTATTDDDGPGRHLACTLNNRVADGLVMRWYFRKDTEIYKVSWRFLWWVKQAVRRFDVVHIHALFSFTSIVAAWAARRAGVPYIIRPLGTLASYGRTQRRPSIKRFSLKWIEGPLLRDAAAVHFTSLEEQREAEECGVPMRGVVIPLGIEAAAVNDASLIRLRFPALQDANYLLFLSRLDPKKNVEGLLRAFAKCSTHWPYTKLLIAGDGAPAYVASLVALASAQGLADQVVWAGHIAGALKASALAGAKLFVLPSFSENFGIAAAEALMAGLPCVLGQGVAIAADVAVAKAGVIVAPEPDAIAEGIGTLLTASIAEHINMSANAVALAKTKFSVEAMGRDLVVLYDAVAADQATGSSKFSAVEKE